MEVVKHLHQTPGRMKRTGALQSVEDTGPTSPAVKAPVVSRPFLAREDEYLRKHYCIDQGPSECANVLRRGFQTVVRRAAELEIDHLRAPWKALQASRAAMARVAAERLGAVKKEDAVQPYRPDYMSGPSWAGFESSPCKRAGGDDHEKHPSRADNTLVYRDGRREKVA